MSGVLQDPVTQQVGAVTGAAEHTCWRGHIFCAVCMSQFSGHNTFCCNKGQSLTHRFQKIKATNIVLVNELTGPGPRMVGEYVCWFVGFQESLQQVAIKVSFSQLKNVSKVCFFSS